MNRICRRWMSFHGNVRGGLIVLVLSLVVVTMSSLVKQVGQTIPVVEILFFRQLLVLVIISTVVMKSLGSVFVTKMFRYHLTRGFLSAVATFSGFTAVVYMPLTEVMAISFVRTLFTTILAVLFLKEVVGIRRATSVFIGFIGVVVIVQPDIDNINIYALLAIVSALFVSGNKILMRKLSQVENPSTIMTYQSIFVTLAMAVPTVYLWVTPTLEDVIYIGMIGGLMSLIQWLSIQAYKVGEAVAIIPMEYSRLLYAAIIGVIFFAEIPTIWTLCGAIIIILSTLYTMLRSAKQKRLKTTTQHDHTRA